jgi:hypothetical protein
MKALTDMTRPQVHDAMCAADRKRFRIAYAGMTELEDRLQAQGVKEWHKRYDERIEAHIHKNKRTPEYLAADTEFKAASRELERRDGDTKMRDRRGRAVSLHLF